MCWRADRTLHRVGSGSSCYGITGKMSFTQEGRKDPSGIETARIESLAHSPCLVDVDTLIGGAGRCRLGE